MTLELVVSIAAQTLEVREDGAVVKSYRVSTAKAGAGEVENSQMTPRGEHVVCEKFGEGLPARAILKGRCYYDEVLDDKLEAKYPGRDWILSRILWLDGCEEGFNKGGKVDTKTRYIYIHGTEEEDQLGQPVSHGCVRMANADVIELFDMVPVGTTVHINEQ